MGWREWKVDPHVWIEAYAVRRYGNIGGSIGNNLKTAWSKLLGCCYGDYYSTKFKSLVELILLVSKSKCHMYISEEINYSLSGNINNIILIRAYVS